MSDAGSTPPSWATHFVKNNHVNETIIEQQQQQKKAIIFISDFNFNETRDNHGVVFFVYVPLGRESVPSAVGRAMTSGRRRSSLKSSCESFHSKCLQVLALHRDGHRDPGRRAGPGRPARRQMFAPVLNLHDYYSSLYKIGFYQKETFSLPVISLTFWCLGEKLTNQNAQ